MGSGLLAKAEPALAHGRRGRLTRGDAAILRFLAAAEILETDLWQQYNELGRVQTARSQGEREPEYTGALETLDDDMPQYIHDNTDDEISHFAFLNGYLALKGAHNRSIWTSSAPCRAARQRAPSRSDG